VLAVAAMGLAAPLTSLLSRWPRLAVPHARLPWNDKHIFTGCSWRRRFDHFVHLLLHNLNGPLDALRTYQAWLHRAGGASPHIHPWSFYFERLAFFHQGKGRFGLKG